MSTLHVPAQLNLGEVEVREIDSVWDTLDHAAVRAMKAGFMPPSRPEQPCPDIIPGEQAQLTPDQFEYKLALLEAWQGYAEWRMAELKGFMLQCENQMDMIDVDTQASMRQWAKEHPEERKPVESVIKDQVKQDPRWRALLLKKQDCQQEYNFVENIYKRASRTKSVLSRGLSMKQLAATSRVG